MSYFVEYNPELKNRYPTTKEPSIKFPINKLLWCIAAAVVVCIIASNGLPRWMIPGDPDVTVAAFEVLVDDIGAGESVREAIIDFCKEIILHRV